MLALLVVMVLVLVVLVVLLPPPWSPPPTHPPPFRRLRPPSRPRTLFRGTNSILRLPGLGYRGRAVLAVAHDRPLFHRVRTLTSKPLPS